MKFAQKSATGIFISSVSTKDESERDNLLINKRLKEEDPVSKQKISGVDQDVFVL